MNRTCQGDTFARWGDQWGRCFADGGLFKIVALLDGQCPRCSRKWDPVSEPQPFIFDPDTDADVAKEIDVPVLRARLAYLTDLTRCDVGAGNGTDKDCEGPIVHDPQPESSAFRICGKHLIENRDYWHRLAERP